MSCSQTGGESSNGESSNTDQLRERWLDEPKPERLSAEDPNFGACMTAHERAVAGESPGYADPASGLFVMTAVYLRDRGWCCDRGCRHCPYLPTMK